MQGKGDYVGIMPKLKIYLDNCCYHRPYDDLEQIKVKEEAVAKLFIQGLAREKQIILYYSYISISELFDCRIENQKTNILFFLEEVDAQYIGYDKAKIDNLAVTIQNKGIKEKDANHIASAIIAGCDYFLTTDKQLLKYKSENIKIANPVDFVKIWEEYINV